MGIRSLKALAVAGSLGLLVCCSAGHPQNKSRFQEFIQGKDTAFRELRPLRTNNEVLEQRLRLQNTLFEEFFKDPEAFTRRIPKKDRNLVFDAVIDGQTMMRVGRPGDGGKWVYDPQRLRDHAIVYSFGVGDDISFDADMAGLFGCQVYLFDPNPMVARDFPSPESGYACGAGRLFYLPLGLGPVSTEKGHEWDLVIKHKKCPAKSLLGVARSLGHTRVDVLKIDIEGGEFSALPEILASHALSALDVKMVLVEFHMWDPGAFGDFVRLIAALAKDGYLLYRKEINPLDVACAEYAFVKPSSFERP